MARTPWFGGNWKCNLSAEDVKKLCASYKSVEIQGGADVVACPSPVYLTMVKDLLEGSKVQCSAQNVSATGNGAFTGEISVSQLESVGITTTLVGHSERRTLYGESDETVAKKVAMCQESTKMIAAICIGETLEERESGKTAAVNERQLKACLPYIKDWSRIVIAYEPVWAIGTGKTATPQQAQDTHKEIRDFIAKSVSQEVADKVRIVYGGSMNAKNVKELLANPDVDGGLVGGASLLDSFIKDIPNQGN